MVYSWKLPELFKVSANAAGEELERIRMKKHELTAQAIVDESRGEGAVLHSCFDWNNDIAGEKWRCEQAKNMLCCLTVHDETIHKEPVRAFVSIRHDTTYEPIKTVISDEKMHERLMELALRELRDFKRKYALLKEVSPFQEVMLNIPD